MAQELGTHSDLVEAFLDEVRGASVEDWRRYLQRVSEQPRGSRREVFRTLDPRLSGAVATAVDRAADAAYRSLRLSSDQFPGQEARFVALHTDVIAAAQVVAAGATVPALSRRVLLEPFAAIGSGAVREALGAAGTASRDTDAG